MLRMNTRHSEQGITDNELFLHADSISGEPVMQPLKSMEELQQWHPIGNIIAAASKRLNNYRFPNHPRTLVCHDMQGGYLEDSFIQGAKDVDCYKLYNWSNIDIFVYFSHHFVTIPPPAWTNAGHINNVPVLGTIITEWQPGKDICEEILQSEEIIKTTVNQLVTIAVHYKFDGWLVNIENMIEEGMVPSLICFVRELTKTMKMALPFSQVIWYDSVVTSGILEWQNELNDMNYCFFEACDGIFLNYTWKEGNLQRSKEAAKNRMLDVYVGVDVFGRGCKGGGGFNTIEAVKDARDNNLSVAIFGQAWVYEKYGPNDFHQNDRRFWNEVSAGCTVHKVSALPLVTSFCQGWGQKFFMNGEVLSKEPWCNMSHQCLQPIGPQANISYDDSIAYVGGGCIKITRLSKSSVSRFRIFEMDINLSAGQGIHLNYTFYGDVMHDLEVTYKPLSDPERVLCLVLSNFNINGTGAGRAFPFSRSSNEAGWTKTLFRWIPVEDCTLQSVSVVLYSDYSENVKSIRRPFRLGSLEIVDPYYTDLPVAVSKLRVVGDTKWTSQNAQPPSGSSVSENAELSSGSSVSQNAELSSGSSVSQNAELSSGSSVSQNAELSSGSSVSQNAELSSGSSVSQNAEISSGSSVSPNAELSSGSSVSQNAELSSGSSVSVTLSWDCNREVDYFVVYSRERKDEPWIFLGLSHCTSYRICQRRCKKKVCSFKIQPVYCAGLCQPLDEAPMIRV